MSRIERGLPMRAAYTQLGFDTRMRMHVDFKHKSRVKGRFFIEFSPYCDYIVRFMTSRVTIDS